MSGCSGHIRYAGQSLVEYVLIGSAVCLVAIVGLMLLGSNLSTIFSNMLASGNATATTAPSTAVVSPPSTTTTTTTAPASIPSGSFGISNLQGAVVKLSDGTQINLPLAPNNVSNVLQTAGANGTTEMLANTMQQTADQLLAEGKITQAQYGLFTDLANQGHAMGAIEQQIEAISASSKDYNQFLTQAQQTTITYKTADGSSASTDLSSFFTNSASSPPSIYDPITAVSYADFGMNYFNNLYNQLQNSGALNDPVLENLVQTLSNQIVHVGISVDGSVQNVVLQNAQPSELDEVLSWYYSNYSDDALTSTASNTTHVDSAVICTSGGGLDPAGTHCLP